MRNGLTFAALLLVTLARASVACGQFNSNEREQQLVVPSVATPERLAELRAYALTHEGDAERGRELFGNEQRTGCRKCHQVDGSGRSVGPNLFAIANKFERPELITSLLNPSQSITIGYGTTIVTTSEGKIHQGILQRVTEDWIELLDKDNKPVRIDKRTIEEQKESTVSMMPDGVVANLSPSEFADLVAYLGKLKQPLVPGATRGVSHVIPRATRLVDLVPLFGSTTFDHPLWMGQIPLLYNADRDTESPRFVVLEQAGRAFIVQSRGTEVTKQLLLDLSQSVRLGGSTGLLGMAFHPQFAKNRRYFIKYQIIEQNQIQTVVEERRFPSNDSDEGDNPPRRLLTVSAVTQDHNGGCLTFGPDGDLYIGMGDSGPQGDPEGHGQDLKTLLGKILRIDIDHKQADLPYSIPSDNPFRNDPAARHEIWAYGFREPWRFSFDPKTADLWVGDVGQNRFEEVSIVRAGENHGWNVYEGHGEHSQTFKRDDAHYVEPVFSYPRRQGVSITGGYVYRGRKSPHMNGYYIAGDYESRRIWALRQRDRVLTDLVEIGQSPSRISSFAEGLDGELFLISFDNGTIYRMDLSGIDTNPLYSRVVAEISRDGPVLWKYTTVEPPAGWTEPRFDDSAWKLGPGGFGTEGTRNALVRTDWRTSDIWLRRSFSLGTPIDPSSTLNLMIHHDDDAEVYLNGIEAQRLAGWSTSYDELPLSDKLKSALHVDQNLIAVHCRQIRGGQYIDAGLIEFAPPPRNSQAP